MKAKQTKMIFNIKQADIFVKNDCKIVGVGLGNKNKVYFLFEVDPQFEYMMAQWDNRKFLLLD